MCSSRSSHRLHWRDRPISNDRSERLKAVNYWDKLFELRDKQRELKRNAIQVVRGAKLPLENNRQGLMRWYMHPDITDTVLRTFMFFVQEIPPGSRSGRMKFQGGQVMYILEGKGHTLIDGAKYSWEARDVVSLPLKRDGIVVQHFNDDPANRARFVAAEPNWFDCTSVDRGSGFEQIEDSPDYSR